MKYLFPILAIALVAVVVPVLDRVYAYVILMWLMLILVAWFDGTMFLSGRSNNPCYYYELDYMAKWPLIIGYGLAFYPYIVYQYEWCLTWVFTIHAYCIIHSRLNHTADLIAAPKRYNVGLMLFSIISPYVYLANLKGKLK